MRLSKGQWKWFLGAVTCVLLAALAAVLGDALLARLHPVVDVSGMSRSAMVSKRGRNTLVETSGTILVACVLPVESPASDPVGLLLRKFAQTSREVAGATFEVEYVDPRTDAGAASRLMAQGANGPGVLFRQAGRRVFVPERELLTERGTYDPVAAEMAVTAALMRLGSEGVEVGWLTDSPRPEYADTDPRTGFSGLRRALEMEGVKIAPVSLRGGQKIPAAMRALLIVNPRYPLTEEETIALAEWLEGGGRLFCALPASGDAGLGALLEDWGIRVGLAPRVTARRGEDGTGLTDRLSADHPITRELADDGTLIAFSAPRGLQAIPVREGSVALAPLVTLDVEPTATTPDRVATVMMAAESGTGIGADLGFHRGRVVVVGESDFATNRFVGRASANRDLAVNAVRWLVELPGSGARSGTGAVLSVNQDRHAWRTDFAMAVLLVPAVICLGLWLVTRRRG